MQAQNTAKTNADLDKIGWYQILGAAAGILIVVWLLFTSADMNSLTIALIVFSMLVFGFSIICGINCLERQKRALKLSLINQAMQCISIFIPGFGFKYAAGIYLTLGLNFTSGDLRFGLGITTFEVYIQSYFTETMIDFNLVAIFLFIYALRIERNIVSENEVRQIAE